MRDGARQRFFAVGRLQQFVAVLLQPRHEDVAVGLVVIDDEDAGRVSHTRVAEMNRVSSRTA